MEVKIKNNEELVDATIEIVDGVMIVSQISKFKPKAGDVIYTHADCLKIGLGNSWVSIFKEYRNGGCATYVDYASDGDSYYDYIDGSKGLLCMNDEIITQRFATEEEKQKLFDRITKEGYEWKADTKELVKIKWKPKVGERFYYPFFEGLTAVARDFIYENEEYIKEDNEIQSGRVFKTEEECQEFCDKLKRR